MVCHVHYRNRLYGFILAAYKLGFAEQKIVLLFLLIELYKCGYIGILLMSGTVFPK